MFWDFVYIRSTPNKMFWKMKQFQSSAERGGGTYTSCRYKWHEAISCPQTKLH